MDPSEKSYLKELDGWVEQLMECKQLQENHVKNNQKNIFVHAFVVFV